MLIQLSQRCYPKSAKSGIRFLIKLALSFLVLYNIVKVLGGEHIMIFKRIVSLLLSVCLVFNFINVTHAFEKPFDADIQLSKTEIEYLHEILSFDPSFEWEGVLVSIEKVVGGFNDPSNEVIFDRFSSNDMTIYITKSIRSKAYTDLVDMNVYCYWNTNSSSIFQDELSVSWAGNFALTNSSCFVVYQSGSASATLRQTFPNIGIVYSFDTKHNNYPINYVRLYARLYRNPHISDVNNFTATYARSYIAISSIAVGTSGTDIYFSGSVSTLSNYTVIDLN